MCHKVFIIVKKYNKQLLFERMHTVGGMPIKEFEVRNSEKHQDLVRFIGESIGYLTYLHTTDTIEKAKSICNTGLRFEIFQKTVDLVNNVDSLEYILMIRKPYGNFTVVIQISKSIKNYESISKESTDEEGNEIFVLPPQHIRGYYDRTTKEIFANPLFRK
jgi:hypothetical protein